MLSPMLPIWQKVTATRLRPTLREQALRCLGQLPPFSPVLNKLIATVSDDDAPFSRVADLVEKDTVLAGNVLRLVNSALYGHRGAVNSVRHAVALLGMYRVRNIALGMAVARMWSGLRLPGGWSMARFNLHSVAAAIVCDMLAQRVPVEFPEGGFTAGLFHDLGRLLIALSLPDAHETVEALVNNGAGARVECEQQVTGTTHAELSAEALAIWNLPDTIERAVRYHHDPDADPRAKALSGGLEMTLSRVLQASDSYVDAIGYSVEAPSMPVEDRAAAIFIELPGVGDVSPLLADFRTEFDKLKSLF